MLFLTIGQGIYYLRILYHPPFENKYSNYIFGVFNSLFLIILISIIICALHDKTNFFPIVVIPSIFIFLFTNNFYNRVDDEIENEIKKDNYKLVNFISKYNTMSKTFDYSNKNSIFYLGVLNQHFSTCPKSDCFLTKTLFYEASKYNFKEVKEVEYNNCLTKYYLKELILDNYEDNSDMFMINYIAALFNIIFMKNRILATSYIRKIKLLDLSIT